MDNECIIHILFILFKVREVASPDVGKMGIEILSFTIKDVFDTVDYLASLGKSQTAAVIRDADIGVANSNRDAGIKEAECQKVRKFEPIVSRLLILYENHRFLNGQQSSEMLRNCL